MVQPPNSPKSTRAALLDENEQLRTALEAALEENAVLVADRDRLRRRMTAMASEVRAARAEIAKREVAHEAAEKSLARQSQTEEELRIAFEELQVLTEELEVANTSLHQTNQQLDARVEDRTRQIREVNASLQAAEASFCTVADLVPDLLWRADSQGEATWFNRRWFSFTGQADDEPLGYGWLDAVHPADRAVSRSSWGIAISSGHPYQNEHRVRDAAGDYRWFLVRAEPLRDDRGGIRDWFVAGTDIHEQRTALEALQQSEARFRTLIEGMPQLVWRAGDGGKWTWSSPQWSDYTGQSEQRARLNGWLDAFHPDDREAAMIAWAMAQETGSLELEGRICHASAGRYRHFRTRALPVRDDAGRIVEWLGTSTDVDDILQLQERQSVLVGELQHRTRNLMAVVQAVTLRTLRGVTTLDEFRKCIDDRLGALARVQGLLSRRDGGQKVEFDVLLREEMSAHVELDGSKDDQVALHGPAGVPLRSAMVQTFALALHELATNAVKYGALSVPDGRLEIAWEVREAPGDKRELFVDWRERGVSPMPGSGEASRGGGYGRELIERALPYQLGARTTYGFSDEGVHCTITVPVPAADMMENAGV